jgi:hypothetical protein
MKHFGHECYRGRRYWIIIANGDVHFEISVFEWAFWRASDASFPFSDIVLFVWWFGCADVTFKSQKKKPDPDTQYENVVAPPTSDGCKYISGSCSPLFKALISRRNLFTGDKAIFFRKQFWCFFGFADRDFPICPRVGVSEY